MLQALINIIFAIAAICIIVGSTGIASESAKNGSDYGIGWFWGVISSLCAYALWHGFVTGLFWI